MNKGPLFFIKILTIASTLLWTASSPLVHGTVVHDGTLGAAGAATLSGSNYVIMGSSGRLSGKNLFHSFSQFNVEAGRTAWFTSLGLGSTVDTIFSRVTGGSVSTIDGGIRSSIAGASLFFLNPSGVLFGSGATIEIDGAFHLSTADYIKLGSDGLFHASDPGQSVLTASAPSAFGFLSNTPTKIDLGGKITAKKDAANNGRILSVVAGDLTMTNGYLWAPNGRVNVASVASAGEVSLNGNTVDTDTFSKLGNIALSGGAAFWATDLTSVSGGTGSAGSIYIRAGRFEIKDNNTAVYAHSQSTGSSGGIDIEARESLTVKDSAKITAESFGSGSAGNISIRTGQLSLQNGGAILSYGRSTGNAGDQKITAGDSIDITGSNSRLDASAYGNSQGGKIEIATTRLKVTDSGNIQSATLGSGAGGNITISNSTTEVESSGKISTGTTSTGSSGKISISSSNSISVSNQGGIYSQNEGNSGRAGDLSLSTANLSVSSNGKISSATQAGGAAGDLSVSAEKIEISSGGVINSGSTGNGSAGKLMVEATDSVNIAGSGNSVSRMEASATAGGTGGAISIKAPEVAISDGGLVQSTSSGGGTGKDISVETDKLNLTKGGAVYTIAASSGKGGSIFVSATESVNIEGSKSDSSSGIYASTDAGSSGAAGSVTVTTQSLTISDTGAVVSRTGGTGRSGNVIIEADESVSVSGTGRIANNSLSTGTGGDTGDIRIATKALAVSDNGLISSESAGSGSVGNISIVVDRLNMDQGYISSSVGPKSLEGTKGGNIGITAGESVTVSGSGVDDIGQFGEYYAIYAQTQGSGDGGTINIATPQLTVINDGMINADTYGSGNGGSINIVVDLLKVNDGGTIVAQTRGAGTAGNISVSARESVQLNGIGVKLLDSWIYTATHGSGAGGGLSIVTPDLILSAHGVINANTLGDSGTQNGPAGNINLTVDRLELTEGGAVTADSASSGDGGSITITATEKIHLQGALESPHPADLYTEKGVTNPRVLSSGIYARANKTGKGGDINLFTERLLVKDQATVSVKSSGSGNAGDIKITTTNCVDIDHAAITTEALLADGGNISLKAVERVYLYGSDVTATVGGGLGNGGNIFIDPAFVVLNNSRIIANAYGGRGGNIKIIAGNFIADTYSEVEASSQLGIDGTVDIEAPDTDVSGGLTVLPEAFLDITGLLQDRCVVRTMGNASSLFIVGRGGMPAAPDDYLTDPMNDETPTAKTD